MNLLILGGGIFLGAHTLSAAIERGHAVTVFNRGRTRSTWPASVEVLTGDRGVDLPRLAGRRWHAVIDTCGYTPADVQASTEALCDSCASYLFVSSVSAYADMAEPMTAEDHPLASFDGIARNDADRRHYGPQKAACEAEVMRVFGARALIVRPGLVVGPGDPTGRFSHWVWRAAEGGVMLVPDAPDDPTLQFIDVRDLTAWMIHLLEAGARGPFNASGPVGGAPISWRALVAACRAEAAARGMTPAEAVRVGEAFLLQHEVQPWSELPLWLPSIDPAYAGFNRDLARAAAAGLRTRALRETVEAVLDEGIPPANDPRRAGKLTREREAALLAACGASSVRSGCVGQFPRRLRGFGVLVGPCAGSSCCTAAFNRDAMNLHSISNTIQQALASAGLDPKRGALKGVTQTIRKALADAGLVQADAPARTGRPSAEPANDDIIDVIDITAREVPGPDRPTRAAPEAAPARGQFVSRSYSGPGGSRAYKLYIPAAHPIDTPMPLIVMLHGCKQNPDDFARGTGMNALAEQHGFLVAYPEQTARANGSNCWNWFNAADQARDGAEPSIIAGIVREIAAAEAVDKQRVFVAGLSAGAAMAVILGVTHADVFAAVGAHSGLPHGAAHDVASAFAAMHGGKGKLGVPLPVPTIVFHGDQDRTVIASNGDAIVAQAVAGQRAPLQKKSVNGSASAGTREHVRSVWIDDTGRPRVEQWALHGGKHAWSGGSPAGSYTDARGPDASAEMVRFFLTQ